MSTVVTVESVVELNSAQKTALLASLKKKYGKDVSLVEKLNPELIGGIRVTIGSTRIDLSLQSRLDQLAQHMSA